MLESLDAIAWAALPQPTSSPTAVPLAIRAIGLATTDDDASAAYHRFLFAVGNNHAGTYYPVVLETIPFLEALVENGHSLARQTSLDILIDLAGAFRPEPGYETVLAPDGAIVSVRTLLLAAVSAFWERARSGVLSHEGQRESELGRELQAVLAASLS